MVLHERKEKIINFEAQGEWAEANTYVYKAAGNIAILMKCEN